MAKTFGRFRPRRVESCGQQRGALSLARLVAIFVAGLAIWAGAAIAQSVPDDTRVIPTAIPETDLLIDVPVSWEQLPPNMIMAESLFSLVDDDGRSDEELVAFASFGEDGGGVIMISRADGYTRTPLEELSIMVQGIRLSRLLTWIVGADMKITVLPQVLPLGDEIDAATMSFLSGQNADEDVVSMTILQVGEETFLIVDIAPYKGAQVATLSAMRQSIRLRD